MQGVVIYHHKALLEWRRLPTWSVRSTNYPYLECTFNEPHILDSKPQTQTSNSNSLGLIQIRELKCAQCSRFSV